jgi:DNA-binding transcriptional ArsR family regulator
MPVVILDNSRTRSERRHRKAARQMITIPLSTEDLTRVRLAPSPLWETVTSFGVLLHQAHESVHAPWAARARRVLPGTDLSALVAAMGVAGRCPDFLTPPPDALVATFWEELDRLRATPTEVVYEDVEAFVRVEKEQFGSLAPEKERMLEIYLSDPDGSLERLVDELRRYYDLALAPYWPRIQEHLQGDAIRRGQALALGGVEALLSGLHPKARYCEGALELDKAYEAVVEPAGRGITLVPCVFAWPRVEVLVQPSYRPTIAYGPRGVANLWATSSPPSNGTALGAALGDSRASVLKSLLPVPITTTELARQLDLAPAAVSAHLSRLKDAGLVESHRTGKKVYYRLSGAGESLLGIFGETGRRPGAAPGTTELHRFR